VDDLKEMDTFLDALSQEDINHLRRSTASNAIEAAMKSLLTKKSLELGVLIHCQIPDTETE
jgi:adenine C2-methylase RlmN of 23S rRNA A2503 and tRNA A37